MRHALIRLMVTLGLLLSLISAPSLALENHQGGQIRVKWSTKNMFLKPGISLEQELTPTALAGMVDGAPFRWSNQYHWDFCWQGSSSMLFGGNRCGFIGFGLGSMKGNTYYGNFDFALFNGLEFQKISGDSRMSCNKGTESVTIGTTKTYYVNCWYPVTIQMNTTYILRVQSANDSSSSGENWWSATLTNKKSNETITIGKIRATANDFNSELASLETVIFYDGDKKNCDSVPVMDLVASPLVGSNGGKSSFVNASLLNCVRAVAYPESSQSNNYVIRLGGSSPLTRDPSYVGTGSISSGSSNANPTTRRPRDDGSWARPKDLITGLSEVRLKGYFRDDPLFFANAERLLIGKTSAELIQDWSLSREMGTNVSIWWGGYFIPDESGPWDFQMTSDDAAFMWLGAAAVVDYQAGVSSAFLGLPGVHSAQSKSASIYLEKDKIYPLRIQYGNEIDVGSFKLEVKAPSHKTIWDKNLLGLIWHTDFSKTNECTNYGISYTLSQSLGYGKFDVPLCGEKNPIKALNATSSSGNSKPRPNAPTFSAVNFNGNTLNVEVNIGSEFANRPERVLLVAPKLGLSASNPLEGKISGDKASWAIKFDEKLSGVMIPLEIVGEKDGINSEPLLGSYQPPQQTESLIAQTPPPAPENFKSRILGNSALITVSVKIKSGALASKVFMYSKDLQIPKDSPLPGDVFGDKAFIEVPVKGSMVGKKFLVNIYLANPKGQSKVLEAVLSVPKPASSLNLLPPKSSTPKTVICARGNQTRAFSGVKCPPGWNQK
jgi:hypothetical protein